MFFFVFKRLHQCQNRVCYGHLVRDLLGLSYIAQIPSFHFYVGMIGGIILVLFGLLSIISKPKPLSKDQITAQTYGGYFLKGAAINVFNPFIFIFWGGIVSQLTEKGVGFSHGIVYLATILVTVALTDVVKVYLAEKIRHLMTEKHMFGMRVIAGSGLIVFGLLLMYRVMK